MIVLMGAAILLSSLVVSAILTGLTRPIATRLGLVSYPRNDRYCRKVVPLGGGIAIFLTILLAILSGTIAVVTTGPRLGLEPKAFSGRLDELIWMLICMAGAFALGLWDDKSRLGPIAKLTGQMAIAAVAAVLAGVRVHLFIHHHLITTIISALWIALLMNVFNFLDNMDGLCAGIAAIVVAVLLAAAASSGQILVSGLALATIGSLLGFLIHNLPPAKIFMGDAGSLLVGFLVAVLSVRTTYYHQAASGPWYPVLMPLVALAVPLYDFTTVVLLRIRQGRSPFVGDTQHFSHRLKRRGLTDLQTALTLYLATICTGLGAIYLYWVDMIGAVLIGLQTSMLLAIIAILETYTGRQDGI